MRPSMNQGGAGSRPPESDLPMLRSALSSDERARHECLRYVRGNSVSLHCDAVLLRQVERSGMQAEPGSFTCELRHHTVLGHPAVEITNGGARPSDPGVSFHASRVVRTVRQQILNPAPVLLLVQLRVEQFGSLVRSFGSPRVPVALCK